MKQPHSATSAGAQYIQAPIIQLTTKHLAELKTLAANAHNGRFRYCLHESHEAAIQEMIICLHGMSYFPPHRHPTGVVESYHMIEGQMDVFTFDDAGNIIGKTALAPVHASDENKVFFHKVTSPCYHTVVPRSEYVIYHEVLTGPWVPDYTSQTAPFSPAPEDRAAVDKFIRELNEFRV
ncbi:WbuC family cupin fold metalloprotein [Pseudoalteromonas ardens]|uniref:Cupin fold metalloprotein WbuC cupin domain-containing protein n=1 Tax=Pseudoalteromonas rubra TaxID=43658 RepID=A0A0L0EV92_9GAMM|nr:WbuC family cupin fold metalloprotein [Pseudoalteromonas sp. R96]KNC68351.1 hypothetical protein AC626_05410 [Pseudoalteromonas rubra]MDK1313274.1 WbuC family cupin fold metalloprotein [Pseudoalteromonas sp. R96]